MYQARRVNPGIQMDNISRRTRIQPRLDLGRDKVRYDRLERAYLEFRADATRTERVTTDLDDPFVILWHMGQRFKDYYYWEFAMREQEMPAHLDRPQSPRTGWDGKVRPPDAVGFGVWPGIARSSLRHGVDPLILAKYFPSHKDFWDSPYPPPLDEFRLNRMSPDEVKRLRDLSFGEAESNINHIDNFCTEVRMAAYESEIEASEAMRRVVGNSTLGLSRLLRFAIAVQINKFETAERLECQATLDYLAAKDANDYLYQSKELRLPQFLNARVENILDAIYSDDPMDGEGFIYG